MNVLVMFMVKKYSSNTRVTSQKHLYAYLLTLPDGFKFRYYDNSMNICIF